MQEYLLGKGSILSKFFVKVVNFEEMCDDVLAYEFTTSLTFSKLLYDD